MTFYIIFGQYNSYTEDEFAQTASKGARRLVSTSSRLSSFVHPSPSNHWAAIESAPLQGREVFVSYWSSSCHHGVQARSMALSLLHEDGERHGWAMRSMLSLLGPLPRRFLCPSSPSTSTRSRLCKWLDPTKAHAESSTTPAPIAISATTSTARRAQRKGQRQRALGTYASIYAMACAASSSFAHGSFCNGTFHSSQSATALPSMQPFPKPKGDKDETELNSLRKMYKDLKGKPNLPEDIKVVLASAEATLRKEDAKSHKQLVDLLKAARKKLADLDEQWEAYRVQWATYIDKASQMWLSHVEAFEHGESKFAEKRQNICNKPELDCTRST